MISSALLNTLLVLTLVLTVSQSKPHFQETIRTDSDSHWETSASNGTHVHYKNSDGVDEILTIQEYNEKYPKSKQDALAIQNTQRKVNAETHEMERHISEMMAKTRQNIMDMNRRMEETFRRNFNNDMFPFAAARF